MALITSTLNYTRSTNWDLDVNLESSLTISKLLFTVKTTKYDSSSDDSTAIVSKSPTCTNNSATISLSDSDIADSVDPGKLYYSTHVVTSDNKIYPFAAGVFNLIADTTNRSS